MRLEHLLSGAMLSLYDSAMNCTIYLEKWYVKESKFRVLHYVVYDIKYSNQLTVNSKPLAVNSYEAVKCETDN